MQQNRDFKKDSAIRESSPSFYSVEMFKHGQAAIIFPLDPSAFDKDGSKMVRANGLRMIIDPSDTGVKTPPSSVVRFGGLICGSTLF